MRKCFWGSLLVILLLSSVVLAKDIEFWMVGWSNEMAKVAEGYINSEYTPKSGNNVRVCL